MAEPSTGEFIQMSYLCDLDEDSISENKLFDTYKSLREMAKAKDRSFMKLGIYPVSIYYEREERGGHKVICRRENSIDEFRLDHGNVYKPNKAGINILCKMKHLRKQAA